MRHDWIVDVLVDLRSYADKNDLQALAAQVELALRVAELEIAESAARPAPAAATGAEKPGRRAH